MAAVSQLVRSYLVDGLIIDAVGYRILLKLSPMMVDCFDELVVKRNCQTGASDIHSLVAFNTANDLESQLWGCMLTQDP